MSKDKRKDIRIPLLSERVELRWLDASFTGMRQTVEVADISEGGLFIKESKVELMPKPGVDRLVCFQLPGDLGLLMLNGKVRRVKWRGTKTSKETGYAIAFNEIPPKDKKIYDAYRVYMRNRQIITVSKRIIEEFFGPSRPKH